MHKRLKICLSLLIFLTLSVCFVWIYLDVTFNLKFNNSIPNGTRAKRQMILNRTLHSKVKDCLTGEIVYKYNNRFNSQLLSVESFHGNYLESSSSRKAAFINVYSKMAWGNITENHKLVHSGIGSTLHYTPEAMGVLHTVINYIKQKTGRSHVTMLDIPCGDMTWMSRFLTTRDDIYYTGVDIVPEVISNHKRQYSNQTKWKFVNVDILQKNVTIKNYDLIFSRMMMQHLVLSDVMKLLMKISSGLNKYILMTSHNNRLNKELPDIDKGRYRPLNLQIAPYKLIPPICLTRDGPPNIKDHFLGLWQLPLYTVKDCHVLYHRDTRNGRIETYPACGIEAR